VRCVYVYCPDMCVYVYVYVCIQEGGSDVESARLFRVEFTTSPAAVWEGYFESHQGKTVRCGCVCTYVFACVRVKVCVCLCVHVFVLCACCEFSNS